MTCTITANPRSWVVSRTNLATDPNGVTFATGSWQSNNGTFYTVIKESSVGSLHPQGIKTGAVCRSTASNTGSTICSVYGLGNTNKNTGPASWDGVWVYASSAGYQARWYSGSTNYSAVVTLAAATWTWIETTSEFPANVYHEFGVARADGTVPPTTDFCFLTGVDMEAVPLDPTIQSIWGDRADASNAEFAWTGTANASSSTYSTPNPADVVSPELLLGYEAHRTSQNQIDWVPGVGYPTVNYYPLPSRNGSMQFLMASVADAEALENLLLSSTEFVLEEDDAPIVNMTFALGDGDVVTELDTDTRADWTITIPYVEVSE